MNSMVWISSFDLSHQIYPPQEEVEEEVEEDPAVPTTMADASSCANRAGSVEECSVAATRDRSVLISCNCHSVYYCFSVTLPHGSCHNMVHAQWSPTLPSYLDTLEAHLRLGEPFCDLITFKAHLRTRGVLVKVICFFFGSNFFLAEKIFWIGFIFFDFIYILRTKTNSSFYMEFINQI